MKQEKISRWVWRQISEQQVRFFTCSLQQNSTGLQKAHKKKVSVSFSVPPWELRREERAALAASHKVLTTLACGTEWKIWGAEPGTGCFSQGNALCPSAAQAACPAPGKGHDGMRESLTLLPSAPKTGRVGVEIQQMCNTSCEEWWVAGAQPKFVVLCGMEPGQPLLASQSNLHSTKTPHAFPVPRKTHFSPSLTQPWHLLSHACAVWALFNKKHPQRMSTQAHSSPGGSCHRVLTGQGWHQGEHKTPPVSSQGFKLKSEATGVLQRCHPGIECHSNPWRLFSTEAPEQWPRRIHFHAG